MKHLVLFVFSVFIVSNVHAKGGIPIIYSIGEDVEEVRILPYMTYQIQGRNGDWHHANLGILHKQFSLFGVPLINYGTEKYVFYAGNVDGYDLIADLSADDLVYLQSVVPDIPNTPQLPFWDAWGGKLFVLLLIATIIFYEKYKKSKEFGTDC